MKIKLSKSQWMEIGKTANWLDKKAAGQNDFNIIMNNLQKAKMYVNNFALPDAQNAISAKIAEVENLLKAENQRQMQMDKQNPQGGENAQSGAPQ